MPGKGKWSIAHDMGIIWTIIMCFFAPFKNFMADAHHIYDFKPPKCISFISFELAMPEDGDGQCILYGMMHSLSHTTLFCEK